MSEPILPDYSNVRIVKTAMRNPPYNTRCSIYGNVYSRNLVYLARLTAIAKADYPHLQDGDIEIVVYGGDYIKFHMGIEFSVNEVADGYRVGKLEPTLTYPHPRRSTTLRRGLTQVTGVNPRRLR